MLDAAVIYSLASIVVCSQEMQVVQPFVSHWPSEQCSASGHQLSIPNVSTVPLEIGRDTPFKHQQASSRNHRIHPTVGL